MQQTRGFVVALAMTTLLTGASAAKASGTVQLDADTKVAFNLSGATVHCGDTLTQHTKLTRDLNCPGSDPFALRLDGEGIVLDLGGFTVRRITPASRAKGIESSQTLGRHHWVVEHTLSPGCTTSLNQKHPKLRGILPIVSRMNWA
nr:hypothetical protein [Corallococcus llansteffanensis]